VTYTAKQFGDLGYLQDQVAVPTRIVTEGPFAGTLTIRSVLPKEQFNRGGSMHGHLYEWGMNRFTYTEDPERTKQALGLSDEEYDRWLPQITF